MTYRRWMALLALTFAAAAPAQTVYETRGATGKVYSDRPLPGSKAVDLKPLTVIEPLPVEAPAARPQEATASVPGPAYRSLAIVFPEQNGSVAANTGSFEVRVTLDPPLRIASGHAFVLRLDGRNVPGRHTVSEMTVPPEFFGDVVPAGVQAHVVEASVVDLQGAVLIAAEPVSFQTRFVTLLQRPRIVPKQPSTKSPAPLEERSTTGRKL